MASANLEHASERATNIACRMRDALGRWNVAHGMCGCGAATICSWNKRTSERETSWQARGCDGKLPTQPSSDKLNASFLHSGMLDYWGGEGRRWDDDAGCLFAECSRETTLRELIDDLADDFDSGGDCDSFPESVERDEVHDALCAMLTSDGWRDYWSDDPCEYASEYASANEDEDEEMPSVIILLELADGAYPMLDAADVHFGTTYANETHERPAPIPSAAARAQLASAAARALVVKLQERWPSCHQFHICPYCHDGIDPCAPSDKLTMCDGCDTLHHHDCFQHHGCSVFGCTGRSPREAISAHELSADVDVDGNWAHDESPYGSPAWRTGSEVGRDTWYAPSGLNEGYEDTLGRANRDAFLSDHGHLPCVVSHQSGVAIYVGCACEEMEGIAEALNALTDYPVYDDDAHSAAMADEQNDAWESCYRADFIRELAEKFPGLSLDGCAASDVDAIFHLVSQRENVDWEGSEIDLTTIVWGSDHRHPCASLDDGISLDDILQGVEYYSQDARLTGYSYESPSAAERQELADDRWRDRALRWAIAYSPSSILQKEAWGGTSRLSRVHLLGYSWRAAPVWRWDHFVRLAYGPALPSEHVWEAPTYPPPVRVKLLDIATQLRKIRAGG